MLPLQSLIASGTKLWLDSVDPELVNEGLNVGVSGATSNPAIISDLVKTGRFDDLISDWLSEGDDDDVAWRLADYFVGGAQNHFEAVWEATGGDDGYVSFEVDPLLEESATGLSHQQRVDKYVELGRHWARGHRNRMIKVPATEAGLASLEELAAAGITLNVTLIFSDRQYRAARDAIQRGVQKAGLDRFKSVYSIFVSRIDVYTMQHVPDLSAAAQGQVGIVNAKRIWKENRDYWAGSAPRLNQEIVFASTGTKNPDEAPWRYVEALAGSDIQTNPPATNVATQQSDVQFARQVDVMPSQAVLDEIDAKVDFANMEETLMAEGLAKFANPQRSLLGLIAEKREQLVG